MNAIDFSLDLKALEEDGSIQGLAAGYGNKDYGGDVMLPGSAVVKGKAVPMLLYHDQRQPVGVWTDFKDSSSGLQVKGRFAMSTVAGKEAYSMTKEGAIGGLSIGYQTVKHAMVGKVRQISEAIIHEISLVTVPMNDRTLIAGVKDILGHGDVPTLPQFEEFLREAGFSKTQATAIAGKGLSHLLRSESGSASDDAAEFYAALRAL